MNFKKMLLSMALISVTSVAVMNAQAATDDGTAVVVVEAALTITNVTDLDFGTVVQSDAAGTVAPGDAGASEFAITGQPATAYTITLPAAAINMTTGAGDTAQRQISVDTWTSNPAAGANGLLDGAGEQSLFVGATHAAILADQEAGSYSGTFTVEVVY